MSVLAAFNEGDGEFVERNPLRMPHIALHLTDWPVTQRRRKLLADRAQRIGRGTAVEHAPALAFIRAGE